MPVLLGTLSTTPGLEIPRTRWTATHVGVGSAVAEGALLRPSDVPYLVEADRLAKVFDGMDAVEDVSFAVEPGRIFGLIGPSGSGKTTTIRMLTGILRPTRGTARVFGRDPTRFRASDREAIGYLPQHFVLYQELSVLDNLGFVAGLYDVIGRRRRERIKQVLEFVELWESRHLAARELSGGMQRRLGLAAAILHEPTLLFVDEPTAGIDPVLRAKFWDGFRELRDRGCTIFMTTQYVTEAEYCDRVAVLRAGRLVALGTPSEIRRQAIGGESLELEADGLSRSAIAALSRLPHVLRLTALSPEVIHLIVDDEEAAVPVVREAATRLGLSLRRLEPRQPSFDEVFVLLMEQEGAKEERRGEEATEGQTRRAA
jgi:ABC-2 type transport system ATP-binding protein